jgi:hypothetical protein
MNKEMMEIVAVSIMFIIMAGGAHDVIERLFMIYPERSDQKRKYNTLM